MKIKGGMVVPTITVFRVDESFDEENTRKHVNFLIENGAQGIIACAGTGEFIAMTPEERKRVAEVVADEVKQKIPVYVHTGDYRTETTIELTRHAKDIGVDGVMILLPYCMSPTRFQILNHFRLIAKQVSIPIIIYDNPWDTGIGISSSDIQKLVDEGVVVAAKLTHESPNEVHKLKYLCGDRLCVFYGADNAVLEALLCGADGWISGIHNLIPKMSRRITDAALSNNVKTVLELWQKVTPLINMEVQTDNERSPHWLALIKSGLQIIGRKAGKPRRPILPLEKKYRLKLEKMLKSLY